MRSLSYDARAEPVAAASTTRLIESPPRRGNYVAGTSWSISRTTSSDVLLVACASASAKEPYVFAGRDSPVVAQAVVLDSQLLPGR